MMRLYRLPEVAKILAVSVPTLRTWQAKGRLQVVRLPSGTLRVTEAELERIIGSPLGCLEEE